MSLDALWHVGLVRAPIARFLAPNFTPDIEWLPAPPLDYYYADPFTYAHAGKLQVACEAYDYVRRRGELVALDFDTGAPSGLRVRPLLRARHHLSFPCMVQDGDALYCVPEQAGTGQTALYRFEPSTQRLVAERVLLPSFAAADPVLFRRGELWWLLCTSADAHPRHQLHAFYASDLHGEFRAHARSPLRQDLQSRCAGLPFEHLGRLYRPAQDCTERYGAALLLYELDELTPTHFREHIVRRIAPWDRRFDRGLHTLTAFGDCTLLDGARRSWLPPLARAAYGSPRLLRASGLEIT